MDTKKIQQQDSDQQQRNQSHNWHQASQKDADHFEKCMAKGSDVLGQDGSQQVLGEFIGGGDVVLPGMKKHHQHHHHAHHHAHQTTHGKQGGGLTSKHQESTTAQGHKGHHGDQGFGGQATSGQPVVGKTAHGHKSGQHGWGQGEVHGHDHQGLGHGHEHQHVQHGHQHVQQGRHEGHQHNLRNQVEHFKKALHGHHQHHHHHARRRLTHKEDAFSFAQLLGWMPGIPMVMMPSGQMMPAQVALDSDDYTVPTPACLLGVNDRGCLCGAEIPAEELQVQCTLLLSDLDAVIPAAVNPYQSWFAQLPADLLEPSQEEMATVSKSVLVRVEQAYEAMGSAHAAIQLNIQGLGQVHVDLMGQSGGVLSIALSTCTPAVAAVLSAAMPMLMVGFLKSKETKERFKKVRIGVRCSGTE